MEEKLEIGTTVGLDVEGQPRPRLAVITAITQRAEGVVYRVTPLGSKRERDAQRSELWRLVRVSP